MKEEKTKKYSDVLKEKITEGIEEGKELAELLGIEVSSSTDKAKTEPKQSKGRVKSEQKQSKVGVKSELKESKKRESYTGRIRWEFSELAKELGMSVTDLQITFVGMIKIMKYIMKKPPS
jgi:hypothetical protein